MKIQNPGLTTCKPQHIYPNHLEYLSICITLPKENPFNIFDMKHEEEKNNLTPEEKLVKDYLRRGDDFMKIEIYKLARRCYENALALQPENPDLKKLVENVRNLQKKELRAISVIVSVMALIVISVILF